MLIYNAAVHPMDAPPLPRGFVLFEEGVIRQVGPMDRCPAPGPGDLDAQGRILLPGFVDCHCHLGICDDSLGFEGDDCNEDTDPCTPHLRAIDGLYPMDRCFQEAREGGVTTVLTGPGSANPIGGQFAAVKTAGRWIDEMIVRAPVAMKFALGENPKGVYNERKETPSTRMATAALIREQLRKAQEYAQKQKRAAADPEEDPPDFDAALEALVPVVEGTLPAHFHAHRSDDIATAVRIGEEFHLRYVIIHGTEGYLISQLLQTRQAPVVAGPIIGDRSKPELSHQCVENAARLHRAGVPVAICTDHPENPIQYLPLGAALAAKAGLPEEEALRAITLNAARIAGIADRVGSLTPGKDADLALWSGHPFQVTARPLFVWINGTLAAQTAPIGK